VLGQQHFLHVAQLAAQKVLGRVCAHFVSAFSIPARIKFRTGGRVWLEQKNVLGPPLIV
jgi:hypothetical protein